MPDMHPDIHSVTAFAPATCANVAVGFDILGFSFDHVGDFVSLERRDDNQIVITELESDEPIPLDPLKNTASVVVKAACDALGLGIGFSIRIQKGIPLSSGMGGSAASAVGALVALNGFLKTPLSREQLAYFALIGEALASGEAHGDNIVPCIWGGLTLLRSLDPIDVIALPMPYLHTVLVHPHLQVATQDARRMLRKDIPLLSHVTQSAHLASFVSALYQNDMTLLASSLSDTLIEPQRAHLVPGFDETKQAAIAAGALGASFSGSGPALFAFTESSSDALNVAHAMQKALKKNGVPSDFWIGLLDNHCARIIDIK